MSDGENSSLLLKSHLVDKAWAQFVMGKIAEGLKPHSGEDKNRTFIDTFR